MHDDNLPDAHPLAGPSVFGQVLAAGKVAKTYAEGMTSPCQLRVQRAVRRQAQPVAVLHVAGRAGRLPTLRRPRRAPRRTAHCTTTSRDGTLPTFGLLIPDMCNDAHDCSLSTADRWLHGWLGPLLAGQDFRSGRLAVVVTFDEDHRDANNNILTAVLHRGLHGTVVTTRLDHTALSHSSRGWWARDRCATRRLLPTSWARSDWPADPVLAQTACSRRPGPGRASA